MDRGSIGPMASSWRSLEPGVGVVATRAIAVIGLALLAATAAIAALETWVGVADASPLYLLAVVLAAALFGTAAAVSTSVVAFLLYDFLFTSPRLTFRVADPAEWLSLLLFLVIAVVMGRLTALLRERADTAERRVREGVALVAISRAIAMAASLEEAAAEVAARLRDDAEMDAVWVTLRDPGGGNRVVASAGAPVEDAAPPWTLLRRETDASSEWVRIIDRGLPPPSGTGGHESYEVPIGTPESVIGFIVATRPPGSPQPGRGARRILSLAADQLEIAVRRDELRARLNDAEVARQSDALRAAILDSVSHDLRTPIASIRAIAGGLLDPGVETSPGDRRAGLVAIDAEAEQLADLVRSLLDMSRIQAGALRPDVQPYELEDIVETAVGHVGRTGPDRPIEVALPADLPPVLVDAVLFDVAVANVLDNAVRYAPPPAVIRIAAEMPGAAGSHLVLTVEDGGPGVPDEVLSRLFDRFYRVPTGTEPTRPGLGMGLAIARGFVEAMGGTVEAGRSTLGGLAIRVRLPVAGPAGGVASTPAWAP